MSDDAPKSSLELAMERLRAKDAEQGVAHSALTDQQKAAISEARNFYEAKLAQQDVMSSSALAQTFEPEGRATLEQQNRREREHLISERDAKIARIRSGEQADKPSRRA